MPQRDIKTSLNPYLLMNEDIASDTNTDSSQLDMADFDSGVKVNAFSTTYVDGTYTIQLHASDTDGFTPSAATLISGDGLIPQSGTLVLTAAAVAGAILDSLGLVSAKRYLVVRVVSTAFAASGATIMVTAEAMPELRQEA